MPTAAETVTRLLERDPSGVSWLPALLHRLPDIHWGAQRAPGTPRAAAPLARSIEVADGPVALNCCIETDTLVLALEDARDTPLRSGTPADPHRHQVSRAIEAVRALADGRHFGVAIVASAPFDEPHRTTILEGLPHLEREEAEDLYANYWGWIPGEALASVAEGAAGRQR